LSFNYIKDTPIQEDFMEQ